MMRLGIFIFIILALYSVYVDITSGTLPKGKSSVPTVTTQEQESYEFYTKTIEPGETVLSIIEQREGRLPAPIETIVIDFETLNRGLPPDQVVIGNTYKFRIYN